MAMLSASEQWGPRPENAIDGLPPIETDWRFDGASRARLWATDDTSFARTAHGSSYQVLRGWDDQGRPARWSVHPTRLRDLIARLAATR